MPVNGLFQSLQPGGYFPGGSALGDVDMVGYLITDSTQALDLGTAATTGHSLATGDAIFGGDIEVDGTAYFDGALIVRDGSESAPGIASATYTQTGFYFASAAQIKVTLGNNDTLMFYNDANKAVIASLENVLNFTAKGTSLIGLSNASTGTVQFGVWGSSTSKINGATDGTLKLYRNTNKGASINFVQTAEQTLTFPGGGAASQVTSGLIPDGAILLAVTTRVTTANTAGACTGMDIGDGSDVDLFGANIDINTITTTSSNADATAAFANPVLSATEVTITALTANAADAVITVVASYITATAQTS